MYGGSGALLPCFAARLDSRMCSYFFLSVSSRGRKLRVEQWSQGVLELPSPVSRHINNDFFSSPIFALRERASYALLSNRAHDGSSAVPLPGPLRATPRPRRRPPAASSRAKTGESGDGLRYCIMSAKGLTIFQCSSHRQFPFAESCADFSTRGVNRRAREAWPTTTSSQRSRRQP